MPGIPEVIERSGQPYVAIRATVTMDSVGAAAAHFPVLFEWLARHGSGPAGPPLFKYDVIDMASQLQTDPAEQPDMHKWETQLAFLLAS
jgi:hypothetical protein